MKRHLEREKAHREATADMSEELSEGEKGDAVGDISAHDHGDSVRGRMPRVSSVDMMANLASPHADKKLYLVLIRFGLMLQPSHYTCFMVYYVMVPFF